MDVVNEYTFQSTYEEAERVGEILEEIQDSLGFSDEIFARLMLTVSEAVTNGIVHGNKLDESKEVRLKVAIKDDTLVFETEDEGEGFNPEDLPDPLAEENLLNEGGRGVFLMEEYADKVEFDKGGRIIRLYFNLK